MIKRMNVHDYTRVGFYMVTILTAGRKQLFGSCRDNRTDLSEAGEIVQRRWKEISKHRPEIETNTLVVMPDHIHGILYVKEELAQPVGLTIRGFKSGVTSELRKHLKDPSLDVWEEGYHDRIIMNIDTLHNERQDIHANPRRYCVKSAHPELFIRINHLDNQRLPKAANWNGFGNMFLLDKPEMMQVQVSRNISPGELTDLKSDVLEQAWRGAVLISPFISQGEKEIAQALMDEDYGSLILLKPEGFPPLYKPPGNYFDLCAKGRLLVLSPYAYTGHKQALSRERCIQMNDWVMQISDGKKLS